MSRARPKAPKYTREQRVQHQRAFIEENGGSASGYVHHYARWYTPEEARAIHAADVARLARIVSGQSRTRRHAATPHRHSHP